MNLLDALKLRTPLVWVTTGEIARGIDVTVRDMVSLYSFKESDTELYYVNPIEGIQTFKDEEWTLWIKESMKNVDSEVQSGPVHQFERLLSSLATTQQSSVIVVPLAHELVKKIAPLIVEFGRLHRDAFYKNRTYDNVRIVIVTHEEAIPPELAAVTAQVYVELPTRENLAEILTLFSEYLKIDLDSPEELVKAGLGMGESDFIQACATSILTHAKLSPEFIEENKKQVLKHKTILELQKPRYTLDDIGGADNAKKIIRHMINVRDNREMAKELGIRPINKILLIGVPGTGKSVTCEAIASGLGLDIAKFGMGRMFNKFIGESERLARESFKQLRALAPIVAWNDELGRDLSVGQYQGDSGTSARVQGEMLTQMQDLPDDVYYVGAANAVDGLAPEILRADRFDKILFMGFPTLGERKEIFDIFLRGQRNEIDSTRLAEVTSTFTGAEIKALVEDTVFQVTIETLRPITTEDILKNIPNQKNRMWIRHPDAVINMYATALREWLWASSEQEEEAPLVLQSLKAGSSTIGNAPVRNKPKQTASFSL